MEPQETALQVINNGLSQTGSFDISNGEHTRYLALDLTKFIKENKLYHDIQGKEYVNVEGWQYAGSRLGILPRIEELSRIATTDETEIRYQAKVFLIDLRDKSIVGSGFALCSNKESGKKFYQEFAIASMAQTRAIGKAYRSILAWIIRAAGYEPTPAEEMDYAKVVEDSPEAKKLAAILSLTKVTSRKELVKVAKGSKLADDPDFQSVARVMSTIYPKPIEPAPESTTSKKQSDSIDKATAVAGQVMTASPATDSNPRPMTINQKSQLLLLLNTSCFTIEDKESRVAVMNTWDSKRADLEIANLKKFINQQKQPV